jgi:hypothetical protein
MKMGIPSCLDPIFENVSTKTEDNFSKPFLKTTLFVRQKR